MVETQLIIVQTVRQRHITVATRRFCSLQADELEYAFKRLVDGLAHTREAARPGFSLALGQVSTRGRQPTKCSQYRSIACESSARESNRVHKFVYSLDPTEGAVFN